ncbi:hsp90 co-chaperone Cdc37-like isoform X2 [Tachysurus fulvidraco]|nr:hsp90 co-chaperone Cdc37-like isoform X2 [Tachysurus fulvidraco]XP_047658936.1 hsp90 co-chaperone Cdc37-like isoform X2 [Tachysurus fulvidraco]
MEAFQMKGVELEKSLSEVRKKLSEAQRKVKKLEGASTEQAKKELEEAKNEEKQLRKEERSWEKKIDEHRREEKKMPWNVDTLSKEGFSKSVLNIKPEVKEETEEEKEKKHKTFVEKYETQIKHFETDHYRPLQAHQTIVMQFSLKIDPRGCFRQFSSKIKEMQKCFDERHPDVTRCHQQNGSHGGEVPHEALHRFGSVGAEFTARR